MEASFIFLIRESTPEAYEAMSPAERRRVLDRWNDWVDGMIARGQVPYAQPLESAGRLVGRRPADKPLDGPFAEAKEMVGGLFLVAVGSLEEATALAETCPSLPYGLTIEVRPIAGACHLAHSLGWETMKEPEGAQSAG